MLVWIDGPWFYSVSYHHAIIIYFMMISSWLLVSFLCLHHSLIVF
jgi:hypothetical protein